MVMAPTLLDLLPTDVAAELRLEAARAGIPDEAAVVIAVKGFLGFIRASRTITPRLARAEADLARFPVRWLPEIARREMRRPEPRKTRLDDVVAAVIAAKRPVSIREVCLLVEDRTGRRLSYTLGCSLLRWALAANRIRQAGYGQPYEAIRHEHLAVAEPR